MPENNQRELERLLAYKADPELAMMDEIDQLVQNTKDIADKLKTIPIQEIEALPGKDGYTPQRGTDYATEEEMRSMQEEIQGSVLSNLLGEIELAKDEMRLELTPIKGIDYRDGFDGRDGLDGLTPVKRIDYFTEDDIQEVVTASVEYLEGLSGDARLDASAIKNLEKNIDPRKFDLTFLEVDYSQIRNVPKAGETLNGVGGGNRTIRWLNDITNATTAATGTVLTKRSDGRFEFSATAGLGDMLSSIYDPANRAEQVLTTTDAASFALAGHDHDLTYAAIGHDHDGVYAPVLGDDDNYVTDAEKTKLSNISVTQAVDLDTMETGAANGTLAQTAWIDTDRLGFTSLTTTSLSFNDSTYVFTLTDAGSGWSYYRGGVKYTITGNKTATLPGTPPTTGIYYIYIDANDGTLTASDEEWTLRDDKVPVATIFWDNSATPKYWIADERHGFGMDRAVHYYIHAVEGAKVVSPPSLTGHTINTDTDAAKTFTISASTLLDQDILHNHAELVDPQGLSAAYVIWYRTDSNSWTWKYSIVPFDYTTSGYINYDNAGTQTEGASNKFYNTYLLVTNATGAARYVFVSGRSEFGTLAAAQAEDVAAFDWTGVEIGEAIIAYRLTWKSLVSYSSTGKCQLAAEPVSINIGAVTNVSSGAGTDHNSLSNLQGGTTDEYYHLTAAQATVVANTSGTNTGDQDLSGYFQTANIDDTPVNGETSAPISSNWAYDHAATAASDTAAGHVELATAAETTTGTDATRAVSPDGLSQSDYGKRHVSFVLNGTTALTTSEAAYWRVPSTMNGWNLVAVGASVGTGAAGSSSSGNPTFTVTNVTQSSAAMLSTALTVDANEYTSASAATAAVIDTNNDDVATDDLIKIAVTTAGTGTTYATVTLTFQLP